MRAMDYISSTNICCLVCDTLRLIDKRPIEHGMRVAYMLMKLLECKGGYDEYEAAEFVFLAILHDIGAYRTENFEENADYDCGEAQGKKHAVYGGLFLKSTSPFGTRSEIVLYHHLPYAKIAKLNYEHSKIVMYLNLLEDVDAQYCSRGIDLDYRSFEAGAGERYYPEAVMLLLKCIRRDGMLQKLDSGEYRKELRQYMDYILFTNEEKENYMKFIMHCFSLKGKMRTVEAIMSCCVVDEIAEQMDLAGREKEKLDYAAMLHDIGMLAVDKKILKAPRPLSGMEMLEVQKHVEIGYALLKKYFAVQEIPEIAAAHHELMDGGGYPAGLKESQMTRLQFILQVADCLTAMMNKRNYRQALGREEIINILLKQTERRRLDKIAVRSAVERMERIEKRMQSETRSYLEMHVRINNRYKILVESNLGEEES